MASAILLNRKLLDGLPKFEYDGNYVLVDDGSESGVWTYAFTSSGTFTLLKKIRKATLKIQGGGGGGGAGSSSANGGDGSDGAIETLSEIKMAKGDYSISIGIAGARGRNSNGYKGGDTSFSDLATAAGGTGGGRANGAYNKTHTSIYGNLGKGGLGGTTTQHEGSAIYKYVYTANKTAYMYNKPSSIEGQNMGTLRAGETVYLKNLTVYTNPQTTKETFYMTESGYYIPVANGTAQYTAISDSRIWYGADGNPGVVLLSGKA